MLPVTANSIPDLGFQIAGVTPAASSAVPQLAFRLRLVNSPPSGTDATPIHSGVLNCQVRIEPARRPYEPGEKENLLDLFGTPDRWGKTVRPLLWTQITLGVPVFTGATEIDLLVPCSYDFRLAATRYFAALEGGDIPLCFLFSGTIFYETEERGLQVMQVPWDKEAYFRLPAATWQGLMDRYYPNSAWLCVRRDVFDRLNDYKSRHGLPTVENALESLLSAPREAAAS
jgi:hypothetical protein